MKRSYEGTKPDIARIHIIITVVVMIFIFVHSAMPGEVSGAESRYFAEILASITGLSFEVAHFIVRKAAHFTEFTVLGLCLAVNSYDFRSRNGLAKTGDSPAKRAIRRHPMLAAWIAGTLYACTDELHQIFVEGRSCELRDVCIDATGVALGIAIAAAVRAMRSGIAAGQKGD